MQARVHDDIIVDVIMRSWCRLYCNGDECIVRLRTGADIHSIPLCYGLSLLGLNTVPNMSEYLSLPTSLVVSQTLLQI